MKKSNLTNLNICSKTKTISTRKVEKARILNKKEEEIRRN